MITPTFHFKILDIFFNGFVENSEILIERLKEKCNKPAFDVNPYITLCALDIICGMYRLPTRFYLTVKRQTIQTSWSCYSWKFETCISLGPSNWEKKQLLILAVLLILEVYNIETCSLLHPSSRKKKKHKIKRILFTTAHRIQQFDSSLQVSFWC